MRMQHGWGKCGERMRTAVLWLLVVVAIAGALAPAASAQDFFADLLTGVEVMIGESVAQNVIAEYGPPVRLAPAYQQWVDAIFQAVASQASRKEITYTLQILDSPVVNAFAAPGGYLFVTTGLLAHVGGDADALANVLGHEIAHVEHKHGMNTIGRQLGVGLLLQLLFGNSDETWQTIAVIAAELTSLGWSRDQEHESDDLGQRLAAAAGFDPMGMVRFFGVLQQLQGDEVPFLEFLSTHPLTSDRIERARQRAAGLAVATSARPAVSSSLPIVRTPAGATAAATSATSTSSPATANGTAAANAPQAGGAGGQAGDGAAGPGPGIKVITRGGGAPAPDPAGPAAETAGSAAEAGEPGEPAAAGPGRVPGAGITRVGQAFSIEGLFTIEVPRTWSAAATRDSAQSSFLGQLGDRANNVYLDMYRYPVSRGTTPAATAQDWLDWLERNRPGFEVLQPISRRTIDGLDAASFIAGWAENGELWAFYGTTIVAGGYSYELGFLLRRSEFLAHHAVMDQILGSWRLTR